MFARSVLLLLVLFPAAAEARSRPADLAVQRVVATAAGEVRFEVVNRGGTRSRATTLRVELAGVTATARQRALRPRGRARHAVRLAAPRPGTWKARVCARPRGERARSNDCARALRPLTIPTPALAGPVPTSAGELIRGAAPAPRDESGPAPAATATPAPTPSPAATTTPGSTPTATPTPTPAATSTPTATSTSTPTVTATASPTPTSTATTTAPPPVSAPGDTASNLEQNVSHDGNVSGSAPAPPLAVAWTKTLDAGPHAPVIADGRTFGVTQKGTLYALDLRNGAILWARQIGVRGGGVAYDRGRVYATDDEGFLTVLESASGLVLWTKQLAEGVMPVVEDGLVYITRGAALDGATGAVRIAPVTPPERGADTTPALDGARIYYGCDGTTAVTRGANPTIAWQSGRGQCWGSYPSPPGAVHGGRFYPRGDSSYDPEEIVDAASGAPVTTLDYEEVPAFGDGLGLFFEGGTLVARDATTYAQRWTFTPSRSVIFHGPLVAGQDVYVADGDQVHVLDLRTGAKRWSGSVGTRDTFLGMAIAQGTLVVGTGNGLVAFRAAGAAAQPGLAQVEPTPVDLGPIAPGRGATTNANVDPAHSGGLNVSDPAPPLTRRWKVNVTAHAPLIADGRLFAIRPGAQRLDPLTGAPIWTHAAGATAAAYDRGRLFITNASEGLVALDAETGAKLWSVPLPGERVPVAADGELYVGIGRTVTRYDPASGAVVWTHTDDREPLGARRTVSLDGPYVYAACATLSRATGLPVTRFTHCVGSEYRFAPVSAGHMIEWGNNHVDLVDLDVERGGVMVGRLGSTGAVPAVLGNLAVRTGRGVYAYEFPSWRPRWSYPDPDEDRTAIAPLILGRHVYVATAGGTLRAFDANTGAVVWRDTTIGTFGYPYPEPDAIQMAAGEGLLIVPTQTGLIAYNGAGATKTVSQGFGD